MHGTCVLLYQVYVCERVCLSERVCPCLSLWTCLLCVYLCAYVCTDVRTYVCVCVCVRTCVLDKGKPGKTRQLNPCVHTLYLLDTRRSGNAHKLYPCVHTQTHPESYLFTRLTQGGLAACTSSILTGTRRHTLNSILCTYVRTYVSALHAGHREAWHSAQAQPLRIPLTLTLSLSLSLSLSPSPSHTPSYDLLEVRVQQPENV